MAAGSRETAAPVQRARRMSWARPLLRALHRDGGHLVVGLTIVYAVSGLALNHIGDWDPNFTHYERTHGLGVILHGDDLHGDDQAIAKEVLARLKIHEQPSDVYRVDDATLEITLNTRSLHVTLATGRVFEQGQRPRLLLRAANYLHLNRGKNAWKYVADTYAAILLFLASSGLVMVPYKKGLRLRGLSLVALGVALPVLYVTLS
jgi:hypothetical protein